MKTDWKKITEDAFASEEEHIFSENYCRRRAELQRGVIMEKKRRREKNIRFSAGAAAAAAAFVLIPAGTVAVTHFASGGKSPAAIVEDESMQEVITSEETTAEYTEQASEEAEPEVVTVVADEIIAEAEEISEPAEAADSEEAVAEMSEADEEAEAPTEGTVKYDISFENVPDIFISTDGWKYHYNDGKYHAGGISPYGPVDCTNIDEIKQELFNNENYQSERIEEFDVGTGDDARHVYVSYRKEDKYPVYDENGKDITEEYWKNGWFNRDVLVVFGDTGWGCGLFIHSDITDEDMWAFINGIDLVEAE